MNKEKNLHQRVKDYFFDSTIYIKDRTFVMFTVLMLSALFVFAVVSIILGGSWYILLLSLFGVAVGTGVIYLLAKRNRLKAAKIIVCLLLVLVLRPLVFFFSGGIHKGTVMIFLLGFFYLVLVLEGKFRVFLCILDTVLYISYGFIAYNYPALMPEISEKEDYIFTYTQYILAAIVLTILITFWSRIISKEAKLAEEKTKELDELNKAQNRFFSSMSHEIRTPINTVLGLNEIILRQPDASYEIKKDAKNIQGAGKLLLALINDILDISKIEAGKMDVVPVDYDIKSLLSEIVNMIWLKAEEKGLEFKVGIDPNVPEKLYGDEVRIKQILINLLNNAVKYTKEGYVSLYMECEEVSDEKVNLKISVSDSGMGIKADALPHLFDTFQRQDEEKNRYIEGTGLGLSIVKQLVELMGGDVKVDSVYTEGTTFLVEVLQGVSSDDKVGDINVFSSNGILADEKFEHSFHSPEGRVLIVDDNEMNMVVESKLLEGTDLTVDLSLSGEDALLKTIKNNYDVILMDHLMPGMDGIECYEKIRTQRGGLNNTTPIIVLTANAGGENIELYNNTGFDGYLVKPVSGKQLEDMLISFIPEDKLIMNHTNEVVSNSMSTARGYAKKKQVVITTNNMCDIPDSIIRDLKISTIPFKIVTDEGVFYDNEDVDSDELLRYMDGGKRYTMSITPSKEELTTFFGQELRKAHHVIYITFSSVSDEYAEALEAAKTFENVTVYNSKRNTTGTGVLVMIAGRLAQQNMQVDDIIAELEEADKRLICKSTIRSTDCLAMRGFVSPLINSMLNTLWLRPLLVMKNDKFNVESLIFGNDRKAYEKLVKKVLTKKVKPDLSFVFITYAGVEEDELEHIKSQVEERVPFKRIIFQKASSGIISNTGPGTVGLTFMEVGERNYNLANLIPSEIVEEDSLDESVYEDEAVVSEEEIKNSDKEESDKVEPKELKWYEKIPSLDTKAAINNSGSEEAFLSVLKIYYDSYTAKSDELNGFYNAEDWENYTVKIHALKSSSRLVGALVLGDESEKLEMAGKENNIDYIRTNHAKAMEMYEDIINSLSSEFGAKEDTNLPEIDDATLQELYEGLSEFAATKELDLSRMVINSAAEYRLKEEDADRFSRLSSKVEQMDWDGIIEILDELKDREE